MWVNTLMPQNCAMNHWASQYWFSTRQTTLAERLGSQATQGRVARSPWTATSNCINIKMMISPKWRSFSALNPGKSPIFNLVKGRQRRGKIKIEWRGEIQIECAKMAIKLSLAIAYTIRIPWIRSVLNQPARQKWHLFYTGVFLLLAEAAVNVILRAVINPKGSISAHAYSSNINHEYKRTFHEQVMLWCSVH